MNVVTGRVSLVQRHMKDTQNALEEIYQIAKEKGYEEVVEIFKREYHVGHPKREKEKIVV